MSDGTAKYASGPPCPNGCLASERWQPPRPELLRINLEDGEVSCPSCWEVFDLRASGASNIRFKRADA